MYVNTEVSFPSVKQEVKKSGPSAMVDGTRVYVGDWVGFKSDIEQSGKITKIKNNRWGRGKVLELRNENGFSGEYLRYCKVTEMDADDCWV
jgi:hypothetical protein